MTGCVGACCGMAAGGGASGVLAMAGGGDFHIATGGASSVAAQPAISPAASGAKAIDSRARKSIASIPRTESYRFYHR
jgi:hypothetical protein